MNARFTIKTLILAALLTSLLASAQAASATWLATPTDANWATASNWNPAAAPGDILGTNINPDTATFSATVSNGFGTTSPVVIDAGRNLKNITFSTAAASAYVIGTTGGNALLLSSGGTIQTDSSVVNIQTVNAPIVLQPATPTTAGTYTFSSNAASATHVLNFGGAISAGTTTSTQTLTLTGTNTGANTLSGSLSSTNAAGGLILDKTGAGAWTLGGNASSTLAKGRITMSGGTLNFGSATEAPSLTISALASGGNAGVFVNSGNFNMNAGNLAVNVGEGLVLNGSNETYTQTGGTFSTNGLIEFANGGGISTVNISGGSLITTNGSVNATNLAVRGTTTVNLSGTGTFTAPTLNMTSSQLSGGAATSTFNLDGGTLVAGQIVKGTNGTTGTQTFNFNGGTLQSSASSTTYMTGLTNAFVKAGGAVIDTQAFNITIGQDLLTDVVSTGGGLTKQGSGTLTLSGASTYTGATTISGGKLTVSSLANGGSTSGIGASGNAAANLVINGGTLQYSGSVAASTDRSFTVGAAGATIDASGSGAGALTITGSPTLATNAATTTLNLSGTHTGANTLAGTLSSTNAADGLILNKTGAGAWTLGGNASSTLAKGRITVNGGTLNFGSVTEAPSLTISALASGGNTSLFVNSGNFNMNAGNLTANGSEGLVLQGNNDTYTQTGGTFSTNGLIEFANGGGISTVNISGGSLITTSGNSNDATDLAVRGTTTVNLSGTGTFTTPTLNMSTSQIGSGAATSTFNLDGGTLVAGRIIKGTGGDTGTQTFNFNGGTLQSSASSTTYMTGLTNAFVKAGGAVIDTQAFNDTIDQNLLTDAVSTGGGLTKQGAGTLTLTGANTYTGTTTISAGTLQVGNGGSTGSLGSGAIVNNANLVYSFDNTSTATLPSSGITGSGNLSATAGYIKLNGNITQGGSITLTEASGASGLYSGISLGATTNTLTAASITLSGDVGKESGDGNNLALNTSAANGAINLNISLGRAGAWYIPASFSANAGTGAINITGSGPASSGWRDTPVTLTGALNMTGNVNSDALVTVDSNGTTTGTVSGAFSGSMPLTKTGAGTLTLIGANTYSGTTTISGGTLNVTNTSGSGTGTGTVTVDAGSKLSGTGRVAASANNYIYINGTLQVGTASDTAGTDFDLFTSGVGSTIFGATSQLNLDIWNGAGSGDSTANAAFADIARLFGNVTITTGLVLKLHNPNNLSAWAPGDSFKLFDWATLGSGSSITGSFILDSSDLNLGGYSLNTSNLYTLGTISVVSIPEPSRALLLMLGVSGLVLRRRRVIPGS
ncbi:MAG: autotransporter-associated beta strand repeat-containing protein [Prosthecobacter sp.]|uniref:autotransporter-associated beta strand repeat-containing protein n=1 Tax=Prosthecobacter sp. TaxID=1965333 RepID=UPI00390088EF